jgi:DNA-binding NtrC family response regulator
VKPKAGTTTTLETHVPAVADKLWLIVVSGPDQGRSLELKRGTYVVGTALDCSLVLKDESVSRKHLQIDVDGGKVVLKDIGSKNGTFHGGARFRQMELGPGSTIRMGGTDLRVASLANAMGLAPSTADHFGGLLGRSLAMREVFAVLERCARASATVLIEGETGTGKEVCARAIHEASPRARRPFVVCDAGAIPRSLIESELFGHKRGAFTGADRDHDGLFVAAHGGTIFIDEIGELELSMQPRLLRVLEQRQVCPVGSTDIREVDVRVIAATNRNLARECAAGRFREDLYHRLAVVAVTLPPLRARREDIPMLIDAFTRGRGVGVSTEARALLSEGDWLGNVRQLRNVLERGLSLMGAEPELTPDVLGLGAPVLALLKTPRPASGDAFHSSKEQVVAEWERSYLTDLLRRAEGNLTRAARLAGLARPHLYRLLNKHGLRREDG